MKHLVFSTRRTAVTFLSICFSAAAAFAGGPVAGVPNFEKVNDQVYRGAQPTSEGFKALAGMGVKTVIDLRLIGEHSQAEEAGWVKSAGMNYVSIPLKGMSAPPEAEVAKILAMLNEPSAGPVFVHCRRGADRTGTIVACYRIAHDHWENRKALSEAREMGMSFMERAMQSYVMRFTAAPQAPSETTVVATAGAVQ